MTGTHGRVRSGHGARLRLGLELLGVGALLATLAGLLLRAAWADSVTVDEGVYLPTGSCAFRAGVVDLEPTNPAGFKLLAGAALQLWGQRAGGDCTGLTYQQGFPSDLGTLRHLVLVGRLPTVVLSVAVGILLWLWLRALGGRVAAGTGLALWCLEPTVLAHGHLATGDLPTTAGVLAALACLWVAPRHGSPWWWHALAGGALGFALLSKVSAGLVVPVLVLLLALHRPAGAGLRWVAGRVALLGGTAYALICLVYAPFDNVAAHHLPRPLSLMVPESWLYGVSFQLTHASGASTQLFYWNGRLHERGVWWYYLEAFALKSSLALLVTTAAGVGWLLLRRHRDALLFLALPAGLLAVATSASRVDIGVRYLLPVLPLLVMLGALAVAAVPRGAPAVGAVVALGVGVPSLLFAGNPLAYANALETRPARHYLSDSNLDWGQDGWRLRAWWERVGRPPVVADYFGALPAAAYLPGARDVGRHPERPGSPALPSPDDATLLSHSSGLLDPSLLPRLEGGPTCAVTPGLVLVGPCR